jgi:hypothetical protein
MRTSFPSLGISAVASRPADDRPLPSNGRAVSLLERDHPGVVRTVTLLWGHPELNDFLARVAAGLDPRLSHLEPAAMAELMLLGEIHRLICPRTERKGAELHPIGRSAGAWRPAIHRA